MCGSLVVDADAIIRTAPTPDPFIVVDSFVIMLRTNASDMYAVQVANQLSGQSTLGTRVTPSSPLYQPVCMHDHDTSTILS